MNVTLRKLCGVIGLGLLWTPAWIALFFALLAVLMALTRGGSDVELIVMVAVMARVGFLSGVLFGIVLLVAEHGRALRDLSLARVALWGALGAAVFPLLTERANQTVWTCPFGALIAVALVGIARWAERRETSGSRRLRDVLSACVHGLVRDALGHAKETPA